MTKKHPVIKYIPFRSWELKWILDRLPEEQSSVRDKLQESYNDIT